MFAHFRFAGLRPAPIPQYIARQTQQWAPHERHAPRFSHNHTAGPGRCPEHEGETGAATGDKTRGMLSLRSVLPCWTTEPPPPPSATCIADFELARAGKPKFSKGRGYARGLRPRATPERSLALALRALTCNVVFQYHYFDCLGGEGRGPFDCLRG